MVTLSPGFKDFLWMTLGASIFLGFALFAMRYYEEPNHADEILFKAKRLALVDEMQQALAAGSEAEKSAVMAITDQESQAFAQEARSRSATVEKEQRALGALLAAGGTRTEGELLTQFSRAFAELERVDDEVLALAVKNSNVKAYGLAFGPSAQALGAMVDALSVIVEQGAVSAAPQAKRMIFRAAKAQTAALRIATWLAPHIAEESDEKMDALEAQMKSEDREARTSLDALKALVPSGLSAELDTALSSYARLRELRAQILALSRQNTNVRSLTLSLNQKRRAMLACQAALTALAQAISDELVSVRSNVPTNPRKI